MKATDLSPDALHVAGRNVVLLREAEAIASGLAARNIPALFLKGIALLEAQPAELATRGMADIDVWVPARHLGQASAVLRAAGYASHSNALVLRKQVGKIGVDVDLHGDLWFFGGDGPWRRAVHRGPSTALRTLCAEDAVLHAILHSVVQDGEVTPRALADCRAILAEQGDRFRWGAFATAVAEEGWEQPVALFVARLEAAHPGTVPRAGYCDAPWPRASLRPGGRSERPYVRMLQLQSRWPRKIRLALRILFPDPHFLRLRYSWMPGRAALLLPILRPFLLLAQGVACRLEGTGSSGQRAAGSKDRDEERVSIR
jgi:hypothetical protein